MSELKQLKTKRTSIKAQMTRLKNSLEVEIAATEAQVRALKIEEYFHKFEEIQTKIDELRITQQPEECDEDEYLAEIQQESDAERTVFEMVYYAAATKAREYSEAAHQQRVEEHFQHQVQGQSQNTNDRIPHERSMEIKLPTMKLPEFQGDYEGWLHFKDAFTSMIHDRAGLTPVQKFQYLRSALEGEALQVIGGLETSAENYENAWDLLTKTYENSKLLINTHLNQLLEFPAVSKDKPATIKQLIVHIRTHLKALKTLKLPVDKWDELLIHLVKSKMDFTTKKDWEEETNRDKERRPTLEEFLTFLSERCRTLEMLAKGTSKESMKPPPPKKQEKKIALAMTFQKECLICSAGHAVFQCPRFLQLAAADRINEAKAKRLCLNCLGKGHIASSCRGSTCKKCHRRHNTLLHLDQEQQEKKENEESAKNKIITHCTTKEDTTRQDEACSSINVVHKTRAQVLLSTARIMVLGADGIPHCCRALLDPGSQSNLITEELVKRLKLECNSSSELISGINKSQTNIVKSTEIKIRSRYADYEAVINCLVLPNITERLPQVKLNKRLIYIPEGLQLADPDFHEPGPIDLLIGAGLFWQLICVDSIQQEKGVPRLQNTLLGWIVGGEIIDARSRPSQFCGLITNAALHQQLERFWTQEEVHEKRQLTKEEEECEKQFVASMKRDSTGRFVVALPKRPEIILGDSESQALRRLTALERRLEANPEVKSEYIKFMQDYEDQGHMTRLSDTSSMDLKDVYVLPHQPVIRPDSITTKLRVVFDASAKTSNGLALNDKLMTGPNLQNDLSEIIIRFRAHEFVVTADIAAMFRQIMIQEEDRDMQRIFWRPDPKGPVQTYQLNTVTYGTAPAPYIAIRCLRQLAAEDEKFPQASRILREDFYMDDVLTGATTLEDAKKQRYQLQLLLEEGKFQLRKWRSNDQRILEDVPDEQEGHSLLKIDKDGPLKTLGLLWDARNDTLQYSVDIKESPSITKRVVLSKIAQIFDPLGLLGPVSINAKYIMQQLWQLKTGWDESLPQELQTKWNQYYSALPEINAVKIKRNINPRNLDGTFDLVGFGDASEMAYGACLYAVSRDEKGKAQSHLICSKSRVAPLKKVSLPRLELNAALLLAKLCDTAKSAFGSKIGSIHLWTDSTVTLSWITTQPSLLKTYVANRVTKIQNMTETATWRHVPSKENPADLVSRGTTVEDWKHNELWWQGPKWLETGEWPRQEKIETETSEMKTSTVLVNTSVACDVLNRYSSFEKLQRVIAYMLRFKANALGGNRKGPLSVDELAKAEASIVRRVQRETFFPEIQALERRQPLPRSSKLTALNPFLDKEGLIRVGGRLTQASITEAKKYPVVLPSKHHVTNLIVKQEHLRLFHCGPEQLLHSVRHRYWPISGRRETRKVTRSCLECFRRKPTAAEVIMADLPKERIQGSGKPFTVVGVDYAGPIQLRESRRRGRIHISKAWIAVFVCFATKAVHLELVTELTTEAFLAALRRFIARRGMCSQIVTDNGTNFIGAARTLKEVYAFLKAEQNVIAEHLARQKIEWKFIPPRAPHFGGLWEAAVKAAKRHLNTVTKGLISTFEEYYTLLVEIESILNSRPLTPLSSDPHDVSALTPAHFLVGDSLLLPPEHCYSKVPDNRLSRWQHMQKIRQHFWDRWHQEYLQELQTRQKWRENGRKLEVGVLVLVREDHNPPLHWSLGRVTKVHPGVDGVVRVATIRTKAGLFKRAVKQLCPLPIENEY